MRLACDTGGTFTDLLVERGAKGAKLFKAPTTPGDPIEGVLAALRLAADDAGCDLRSFLGAAQMFIHGTTRAINAVVTGGTARTALLTTAGHPDILTLREGGRQDPFDHEAPFPAPYVPRGLTFEVPERIDYSGAVLIPLDERHVRFLIETLRSTRVEAVACCLLWSISNPVHELRIGQLLDEQLPDVPYTLSHKLNPSLREYRRAMSAAIDASLKPVMTRYLRSLRDRLRAAGFGGQLLVQTSQGGMADAESLARTPIHSLNSGPALAPVAGQALAVAADIRHDIIVADTGGTTYDVTVVRAGRIPMTRETWIGAPYQGHMTGFPSVDVKSIGAGGGSIAWLDDAGLLRVGPASAGARPGPACFGLGGDHATLTDAALVLGYLDSHYFLGGSMHLDLAAARAAVGRIASGLRLPCEGAALAIHRVATESMVQAILDITVKQGIDPADTVLIGGGGAAGLNSDAIGRRLRCRQVIVPAVGAALSAAGALLSDIKAEFRQTYFCTTADFPLREVSRVLQALTAACMQFAKDGRSPDEAATIEFTAEARYPSQVWEIEVPLSRGNFSVAEDVQSLRTAFHAVHRQSFGFDEPASEVEIITWCATVRWRARPADLASLRVSNAGAHRSPRRRLTWFDGLDEPVPTPVHDLESLEHGRTLAGPQLIETPNTTVVVQPDSCARIDKSIGIFITRGHSA